MKITEKLRALYSRYVAASLDPADPEHRWTEQLRFYQYLVRAVVTDEEFGIGADGNARGLLIWFQMGMGKTRLAVAAALSAAETRPTTVVLPRGLRDNFEATVRAVASALCAPDAEAGERERAAAAATARVRYIAADAFNAADQLERAGGLDGRFLIVDEAHNFFRAIINSAAETSNARRLYERVMAAKDLRLLFLTASPAAKHPFELVPCMNMLAGFDLLPPQYETFARLFIDGERRAVRNRPFLANRLVGLVSHAAHGLRGAPREAKAGADAAPEPRPRDDGWFPERKPFIVERVPMGADQYRRYLLAREKEDAEGGSQAGLPRAAAAPPPLALPGSERRGARTYFVRSRELSLFAPPAQWAHLAVDAMPDEAFTAETGPKLALIAERAAAAPGPVLVYSQFVEHGLKPLARFLRLKGFLPFPAQAQPAPPGAPAGDPEPRDAPSAAPRYAIISGAVAPEARAAIVAAERSAANRHGAVLKAILVSKTGAEGLDLKYLRQTHQAESYWDRERSLQVAARGDRLGSHDGLPREEREVQPYLYLAGPNRQMWSLMLERDREPLSVDEVFYKRALDNYKLISAFRALLVEVSIECSLFGFGACRTCVPTGAPLFHPDAAAALRLPDPCAERRVTETEASPLVFEGSTFFFADDPERVGSHVFYEYRPELGGHARLDLSDARIAALERALAARPGSGTAEAPA